MTKDGRSFLSKGPPKKTSIPLALIQCRYCMPKRASEQLKDDEYPVFLKEKNPAPWRSLRKVIWPLPPSRPLSPLALPPLFALSLHRAERRPTCRLACRSINFTAKSTGCVINSDQGERWRVWRCLLYSRYQQRVQLTWRDVRSLCCSCAVRRLWWQDQHWKLFPRQRVSVLVIRAGWEEIVCCLLGMGRVEKNHPILTYY